MRTPSLLAFLLLLPACSTTEDSATAVGAACTPTGAPSGTLSATLDGTPWSAEGVAQAPSGSGVQITSEPGDGWRITLVAKTTADEQSVSEALSTGPVEVPLTEGSGNFAVVYPADGGTSYTTNSGGGTAVLAAAGSSLDACFSFAAAGAEGTITVTDGQLTAP